MRWTESTCTHKEKKRGRDKREEEGKKKKERKPESQKERERERKRGGIGDVGGRERDKCYKGLVWKCPSKCFILT